MKNDYIIEGDTVKIKIVRKTGEVHYALIDKSDLQILLDAPCSWRLKQDKNAKTPYAYGHIKRPDGVWTTIPLHRYLLKPKCFAEQIDHINHDGLDNRRCNLRIVDGVQNAYNRYISVRNKSGVVGLRWDKQKQKWKAELVYKGQNVLEKYYSDKEEATKILETVREAVTKVVMMA